MAPACLKDDFEDAMGLFNGKRHPSPVNTEFNEPLSVFSQQFTLVARDGEHITIPIYDLMSWSKFFRDLLQTGRGELRVELEERAHTIRQFKQLVYERHVDWGVCGPPFFAQVFDLVAFLDKYDCARALQDLLALLSAGAAGTSAPSTSSSVSSSSAPSRAVGGEFPPLVLFAVGARLAQPALCAAALDLPKGGWSHYMPWTHPPGLPLDARYTNTLHPLGIPFGLLQALPFEYTLALALTGTKERIQPGYDKNRARDGKAFLEQLGRVKALAEGAEGAAEEK